MCDAAGNPGLAVERLMVPTRGAVMRFEGTNFGVCPIVQISYNRIYRIGTPSVCGDNFLLRTDGKLPDRSHETIDFIVPAGEGDGTDAFFGLANGFIADVDVGGQVNSLPAIASLPPIGFSYEPATITSVAPAFGTDLPTTGMMLRIMGTNFGEPADPSYQNPPASSGMTAPAFIVQVGRTSDYTGDDEVTDPVGPGLLSCGEIERKSHEELTCMLGEGSGVHLGAVVDIAGVKSQFYPGLISFAPPTITSVMFDANMTDLTMERHFLGDDGSGDLVNVYRGPTEGGYLVTLVGENFGPYDADHMCVFVTWPNRPGVGSGDALQRNLRQLFCDGKESFLGEGEIADSEIVMWTHDKIVFEMPSGIGMRDITVRARGVGPVPRTGGNDRFPGSQANLNGVAFWYAAPYITYFGATDYNFRNILPETYDIRTEGGQEIMVLGRNFGWATLSGRSELQAKETAFQTGGLDIPLHKRSCSSCGWDSGSLDDTAATANDAVIADEGTRLPYAAVMVNFYRSCMTQTVDLSNNLLLDATSPYIEGEDRPACAAVFGPSRQPTIVRHGDSRVVFLAPEGLGLNREVYVSVVEQDPTAPTPRYYEFQSNMTYANYSAPIIEAAIPQRIDIREPNERHPVAIKGINFGPTGSTEGWSDEEREAFIFINDRNCKHPDGLNDGAKRSVIEVSLGGLVVSRPILECQMEYDVVGNKNLSVKVAGQFGHLQMTQPPTLHVVCDVGYYGKDGELCLACPEGGECDGYDPITGEHTYPRPLPEWYNLNSTDEFTDNMDDACPPFNQAMSPKSLLAPAGERDSCIVPCQPSWACVGNNYCSTGYKSEAPMYRCASCDDGFYRRAGECIKCPDNPWLLIVVFVLMGLTAAGVGYYLNRSKINIALIAIGVDYFQVLAIFAMSRVSWPPMIVELFHILSAFNLNIEITAPECSIPDIDYPTKWMVIMLLPVVAATLVVIIYLGLRISRLGRGLRKWQHEEQWGVMVAGLIVIMYFLYLYVSRNVFDIFICVPTEPPDGNLYLQPVFEECGKPGGIQETLLPFAIIALLVYVIGFPTFVGWLIYKFGDVIRRDQLIRAMGFTQAFTYSESYPEVIKQAYQFRAKFSRLYYYFKPDFYFWIMTIIGRKLFVAFSSLAFATNPAFQLAAVNLIIFISYTLQVKFNPYMAPQSYELVLREWRLKVQQKQEDKAAAASAREAAAAGKELDAADADIEGSASGKHYQLWEDVKVMLRYKEQRQRTNANSISAQSIFRADATQVLGILANGAFDYNTVETVLLFCSIIVTLGGIMFESGHLDSSTYQSTRDGVTVILMIVILTSIVYYFIVLFTELHMMMTAEQRRKRLEQQKTLRGGKGEGGAAPARLDIELGDIQMEHNRFVAAAQDKKEDEVAGMEMDAILAIEDMDRYTWTEVKTKLRDMQMRFKEMQEQTRAAKIEEISMGGAGSSISSPTVTNPMLAAARRSGRAFAPSLAGHASASRSSRGSRGKLLSKLSIKSPEKSS